MLRHRETISSHGMEERAGKDSETWKNNRKALSTRDKFHLPTTFHAFCKGGGRRGGSEMWWRLSRSSACLAAVAERPGRSISGRLAKRLIFCAFMLLCAVSICEAVNILGNKIWKTLEPWRKNICNRVKNSPPFCATA